MIRKRIVIAAVIVGIFLGIFSRTLHEVYIDYRSAKGLIGGSGRPMGGDFVCFYLAGQAAANDHSNLYNWENGRERQRALLNHPAGKEWVLPYVYPPPFALLLIPFGKLDFLSANLAWIGFSLSLAFLSVFLVLSQSRFSRRQRIYASLSLLAFTPFTLDCLAGGQTSALGMLILAGIYYLTKKGRKFGAGLVLGFGYYKPPLFLFLALAFFLQKRWRLIGGALVSGFSLVLLSVIYLGSAGFIKYLEITKRYLYGRELIPGGVLPPEKAVGLLSFLVSNLPGNYAIAWTLYFVFFALALIFYLITLNRLDSKPVKDRSFDIRYALGITLSLLFSVQMCTYDVSLLFIPFLLTVEPIIRLGKQPAGLIGLALVLFLFLTPLVDQIEFAGIIIKPVMLLMISWITYLFYLLTKESIIDQKCSI